MPWLPLAGPEPMGMPAMILPPLPCSSSFVLHQSSMASAKYTLAKFVSCCYERAPELMGMHAHAGNNLAAIAMLMCPLACILWRDNS